MNVFGPGDRRRMILILLGVLLPIFVVAQNYVFGPNVRVNDDSPGTSFHSTYSTGQHLIAARGDTVYLVWRDDRNYSHIYFARSTNGGETFGANVRVDRNTGILPALAVDDSGGIHVAWENFNASGNEFIYYAKSTDGGLSFQTPVRACDSLQRRQPADPAIAVSRDGRRVYVVREEYYRILLSRSTDGGTTFLTPDTRVESGTSYMGNSTIAVFNDTVVLVAWNDHTATPNGEDVLFARSTNGGLSFGPTMLLNDTAGNSMDQPDPSVGVDSLGRTYVVWAIGPGGNLGLGVSSDTGQTFRHEVGIPGTYAGYRPSLWVSPDSRLYVGYRHRWGGSDDDVRLTHSPDGGTTFLPPVNPSDDNNIYADQTCATVTANRAGRVFIAWEDNRNNPSSINDDIYFATGVMSAISEESPAPALGASLDLASSYAQDFVEFGYTLTRSGMVRVEVLDLTGRSVALLEQGDKQAGRYVSSWDCRNKRGERVHCGIYFLRLVTWDGSLTRKFILLQ